MMDFVELNRGCLRLARMLGDIENTLLTQARKDDGYMLTKYEKAWLLESEDLLKLQEEAAKLAVQISITVAARSYISRAWESQNE